MEGRRPLVARPPRLGMPDREAVEPAELTMADAAVVLRGRLLAAKISEATADEMVLAWWHQKLQQ